MEHCLICDIVEKHLGDTESIATACARCSAWWAFCQDHDIMKPGKQPLDNYQFGGWKELAVGSATLTMAERAILATYPPEKLIGMATTCYSL